MTKVFLLFAILAPFSAKAVERDDPAPSDLALSPLQPVTSTPGLNVDRFADTARDFAPEKRDLILSQKDLQSLKDQFFALAQKKPNTTEKTSSKLLSLPSDFAASVLGGGLANSRVTETRSQDGQSWTPNIELGHGAGNGEGLSQEIPHQEVPLTDDVKMKIIQVYKDRAAAAGHPVTANPEKQAQALTRMHLQLLQVGGEMKPVLIFDSVQPDGKAPGSLSSSGLAGVTTKVDPDERFNLSPEETAGVLNEIESQEKAKTPQDPAASGDPTSPSAGDPLAGAAHGSAMDIDPTLAAQAEAESGQSHGHH